MMSNDSNVTNLYATSTNEKAVLTTVSIVNGVVGTVANALAISIVITYHQLQTATNILLASLSCSDFLSCTIWLPVLVKCMITEDYDELSRFFAFFGALSSLNSLGAVTAERYMAVFYPYHYLRLTTTTTFPMSIALACYTLSLTLSLLVVTSVVSEKVVYYYISLVSIAMLVIYLTLFRAAMRQERKVQPSINQNSSRRILESKTTKTVGIIVMAYFACWSPYLALPAFPAELLPRLFPWINQAAVFQSVINPFIYYWRIRRFRRSAAKLFGRLTGNYLMPPDKWAVTTTGSG